MFPWHVIQTGEPGLQGWLQQSLQQSHRLLGLDISSQNRAPKPVQRIHF